MKGRAGKGGERRREGPGGKRPVEDEARRVGHAVHQVGLEDVGHHQADEPLGHRLHVGANPAQLGEQLRERHPGLVELDAGAQQSGARDAQLVSVDLDEPQQQGVGRHGQVVGGQPVALGDLLGGADVGHLVAERAGEALAEAEQVAQVAALGPALHQLGDVGQAEPPLQQRRDEPEAHQVGFAVPGDPAFTARRCQQAAVLVGAHVAHGGAGLPGQVVDAQLALATGSDRPEPALTAHAAACAAARAAGDEARYRRARSVSPCASGWYERRR